MTVRAAVSAVTACDECSQLRHEHLKWRLGYKNLDFERHRASCDNLE